MREIMEVAGYIRKELRRAEDYAYEANKHKHQYPDMAQYYAKAAQEHLNTADMLHMGATKMIDNAKKMGAEPTEEMRKVWGYEHDMMVEEKATIMRMLDVYKT